MFFMKNYIEEKGCLYLPYYPLFFSVFSPFNIFLTFYSNVFLIKCYDKKRRNNIAVQFNSINIIRIHISGRQQEVDNSSDKRNSSQS